LRPHNLNMHLGKCDFLRTEICPLGRTAGTARCEESTGCSATSRTQVYEVSESFIMLSWVLQTIHTQFQCNCETSTCVNRQEAPYVWDTEEDEAFQIIQKLLSREPLLSCPDLEEEFLLACNGNTKAIRVLSQGPVSKDLHITHASRMLSQ